MFYLVNKQGFMNIYKIFPFLLLCVSFSLYSQPFIEEMVVLGSGPAGLTAAIYAGQAHLQPLVIEGDECEGQLVTVYQALTPLLRKRCKDF